ncbi:MAG: sugar phosphate isomerase/epimerase [Phycisphaerales bacterium]|nr:sugar phosphate isomerase/epimerase [Phycisphaerales bacterium]
MRTPRSQVSRRDFLAAGAGVLGAAAVLPAFGSLAPPTRPATPRKAVGWGMIQPGSTVLEKFQVAKACGFEGIEIDAPGGPPAEEIAEASKQTGVVIHGVVDSVHWSKTLGDADPQTRAAGVEGLLAAIRDCKAYGGGSVLLVPAVVNENVAYADAYRRSQEEIRKALPLATELGVKISIENVWNNFLLSPMEAARYIDEFESPAIGWHFDIGNIVNYGWPEQWIRTLDHRINRLHVKEYSRKKRNDEGLWKGFDVQIGDGDCGWPRVMQALRDIGFAGWATAEVGGGDEARLREISDRMDHVFAM